jgi:hypothetical protein
MRLLVLLLVVLAIPFVWIVLATNVFRPAPAADRLAGVHVRVASYWIEPLGTSRRRLKLTVAVTSLRDLDECLAFTVDEPFAGRRMASLAGGCVKPRARAQDVVLTWDGLTDDDLTFPSHTLVWGVPGGRCGPLLELFGVCVVEQAGTADFELPSKNPLPSFNAFGSFAPLFPEPSFDFSIN